MSYNATLSALNMGYTMFDTAWDYQVQKGVGKAMKESTRDRSSYFILTKVEGGHDYQTTIG